MIVQGIRQKLVLQRESPYGWFLAHEDYPEDEILLPNKYCQKDFKKDQLLEVFVYTDSEDRLTATTESSLIHLHEFAVLRAIDVNHVGAFMDWGLSKDLLIPKVYQSHPIKKGEECLVYLFHDEVSNRLVGSTKLSEFLHQDNITVKRGQEVDLKVWERTDLGFKVIVDEIHEGLIYHNEVFQSISIGQEMKGFVKLIREDNKLDISLQNISYKTIEPNSQKLLDFIKQHNGHILLTDKSDPEVIKSLLGMSKKNFKRALGNLYKKRMVALEKDGIRLLKPKS